MSTGIKHMVTEALQGVAAAAKLTGRLEAVRTVYEKTDRILSGKPVSVRMAFDGAHHGLGKSPGWTDGETVFLNANLINRDLGHLPMPMIVLHTKAVNYHELGHIMFSPRTNDDVTKWVIKQSADFPTMQWWYAYNALEDQRMEMLFVSKFRPAANYFEAIALKWLVNNQAFLAESYPLIYGRRFISADVIARSRAAFVARYGDNLALRFEAVIDKYVMVLFPTGTIYGERCINDYAVLLREMDLARNGYYLNAPITPTLLSADNGGAEGPKGAGQMQVKKGSMRAKDQKAAAEGMGDVKPRPTKVSEATDDEPDDDDEFDDDDDLDGEDELDHAQGTTAQGKPSDESGDTEGDASGSNSDAGDGNGGNGAGNDPTIGQGSLPVEDQLSAIYDALEELFKDEAFVKELNDTAKTVHALMNGEGIAIGIDTPSTQVPVRPEVITAARRMKEVLARLRTELEETRLHRQTAGTIDFRKFATRKPWEVDFFQTWDPGLDEETDLEAVVLVDLSGSMHGVMRETSEALWAVKKALEALNSRVTVLGFSEASFVLYQPTEKVGMSTMRLFGSRNSTIPDGALEEAHRLLTTTQRKQKLLVSITDGAWQGDRKRQDALVASMTAQGVVSAVVGIGMAPDDAHGHGVFHELTDIRQMPMVATQIVAEALRQLATSHYV